MRISIPKEKLLRKSLKTVFLAFLFLAALSTVSAAVGDEAKLALKNGKGDLDAGRYESAIANLSAAEKGFPLLGDYALLYLSNAYHKLADHKKALEALRLLKEKYPQSPLLKKMRSAELREARELSDPGLVSLYEAFTKDYPGNDEIAMKYAALLKANGENAKASAIFKDVYIRGGAQADAALEQLGKSDIRPEDILERASNLMRRYQFKTAEQELRKALASDDGKQKANILKELGFSLFRQKAYKEAAVVYDGARDLYFKARSLYRAGDWAGFDASLADLLKGTDARAGELLVAKAADRRRAGDYQAALAIYREALSRFPSETEDAMWGMAWSYYLSKEYGKSAESCAELYAKFGDPKYLYWQARSIEALGESARDLFTRAAQAENNFYGALARIKLKKNAPTAAKVTETAREKFGDERVEALLSLGMASEAVSELGCLSGRINNISGLLYISTKFRELGEIRRSLSLVTKLPYSESMHDLWYPLVFWDDVRKIANQRGVDPLIVLSVMREESRFDASAKSAAGACGLMQMMPQTAFRLDKVLKLGIRKESQIHDPKNSIHLGAYYLKSLFKEFKTLPHVLAAYNAGEIAERKWEEQFGNGRSFDEFIEDIPYVETRNYVKKVMNSYFQYRRSLPSEKQDEDPEMIVGKL